MKLNLLTLKREINLNAISKSKIQWSSTDWWTPTLWLCHLHQTWNNSSNHLSPPAISWPPLSCSIYILFLSVINFIHLSNAPTFPITYNIFVQTTVVSHLDKRNVTPNNSLNFTFTPFQASLSSLKSKWYFKDTDER